MSCTTRKQHKKLTQQMIMHAMHSVSVLARPCREVGRAGAEQQSLQAEAEIAVRTARRATCRLKV